MLLQRVHAGRLWIYVPLLFEPCWKIWEQCTRKGASDVMCKLCVIRIGTGYYGKYFFLFFSGKRCHRSWKQLQRSDKKNWCEKKELLGLSTIVAHVNIHFKCEAPRGIREILRRNTFADILYFASVSSNRSIWLVSLQRCALGRIQTNHLQRAQLSFIRVREWVCVRLSAYTEARTQACC